MKKTEKIEIRLSKLEKEKFLEMQLNLGYSNLSEMVRHLILNLNKGGIKMTKEMNKELRELLQVVAEGNNDLWKETIEAAQKLLKGGYYGHNADIENLEERGVKTGFELEKALSQGNWYFQNSGAVNLCPDCRVYCEKRFIDGRCE